MTYKVLKKVPTSNNKIFMEKIFCFHIITKNKSGRIKKEIIISSNEINMWKYYHKHHNKKYINTYILIDSWKY